MVLSERRGSVVILTLNGHEQYKASLCSWSNVSQKLDDLAVLAGFAIP
jgi:hypothetical protein